MPILDQMNCKLYEFFWPPGNRLVKPMKRPVPFGRISIWFKETPASLLCLSQLLCLLVVLLPFIDIRSAIEMQSIPSMPNIALIRVEMPDAKSPQLALELPNTNQSFVAEQTEQIAGTVADTLSPTSTFTETPQPEQKQTDPEEPYLSPASQLDPNVTRTFDYASHDLVTYRFIHVRWGIRSAWEFDGSWRYWTGIEWEIIPKGPRLDTVFNGVARYDDKILLQRGALKVPSDSCAYYPDDEFWQRVLDIERAQPSQSAHYYLITADDIKLVKSKK